MISISCFELLTSTLSILQENVLWDDLTGPEHLAFYGRIKNMTGSELKKNIDELLIAVNLHEDTKKKSRQYSGGMKRRLSVACALMGNPRVRKMMSFFLKFII